MRRLSRGTFDVAVLLGLGVLAWTIVDGGLVGTDATASTPKNSLATTDQQYRLGQVQRRPIIERVSATGTLYPVALVSVSSQVSGQIKEIYADFNQSVRKDDPIALIDPVTFEIAIDQAEADLEIAQASVATQQAVLEKMEADLQATRFDFTAAAENTEFSAVRVRDAEAEVRRKKALGAVGTRAELERAEAMVLGAQAQHRSSVATEGGKGAVVLSAEAQIRSAKAQLLNFEAVVRQRCAALRQAQIELKRTVIRAPVDGTVTVRNTEVGQTVAVSLQAPVLFTIAQDLRQMQVNASVSEAEIGRIKVGQQFDFRVDAYPQMPFSGAVVQIRLQPQTIQNVVSYTVVAQVENPDLLLLPGMTATAGIEIDRTEPELVVPTAALRFRLPGESRTGEGRLYVHDNGRAIPINVSTGTSDAQFTSVRSETLKEGTSVVLGLVDQGRGTVLKGTLGIF